MKNEKFLILTFLFVISLFSACEKKTAENFPARFENSKDLSSYSKIEDVDFRNFTYSFIDNFTIINGEKPLGSTDETGYRLRKIQYADLTNDGKNEAVINIQTLFATNRSNIIFIYTLENEQPKKLQHILSGLNANGGLKDVYAKEENVLTVEFFGDTKFDENKTEFIFPNIHKYPQTECCPSKFTQLNFNWNEKFALVGEPKMFDYNWKKEKNENLFYREKT